MSDLFQGKSKIAAVSRGTLSGGTSSSKASAHSPATRVENLLRNVPLFQGVSKEGLATVTAGSTPIRASAGTRLFRQGDVCHGFYVIVFGRVKLGFVSPDGAEKVMEILLQGQSFGEALMFLDRPWLVNGQTLSDALLLNISKSSVIGELERNPQFARRMLGSLSSRLHGLIGDIEAYSTQNAVRRVITHLLRQLPEAQTGKAVVELPSTKGDIASRLSISREHFSRVLRELSDAGLVQVQGRQLHILNTEGLRAYHLGE
jgi:CRP-like cAMP-binding protein